MRIFLILFIWCGLLTNLFSQQTPEFLRGEVSYVTSKNVYVKFSDTGSINQGDTLFISEENQYVPALIVLNKSTISCVCEKLDDKREISKATQIFTFPPSKVETEAIGALPPSLEKEEGVNEPNEKQEEDREIPEKKVIARKEQKIDGRLTASAYSARPGDGEWVDPRMRYTISFNAENLAHRSLDINSYVAFRHDINQWNEVTENPYTAFKVYGLSMDYKVNSFGLTFGRNINNRISNIGAIDGLQLNYSIKNWHIGVVAGTRPDFIDYRFNSKLPEAGVYVEQARKWENGASTKNTIGIFEQRAEWLTDRRYMYFQHTSLLFDRLYIFASGEIDLFKKMDDVAGPDFRLTSAYLSARYKINNKVSVFASYDNRRNIIYYESYQSQVDQLLEQETRQGFRLRLSLRPFKYASSGISGNYRYQKNSLGPSINANAYFSYSRIPLIRASGGISYTFLDTYYLTSHISGIKLNKDLVKGKLGFGWQARHVLYVYKSNQTEPIQQVISGIDLQWYPVKDFSLALHYEATITTDHLDHRTYLKAIKRIR